MWTVEHHFTDYTMCPDPLQLLTWLAGRTERVLLGTGVVVLPWHDPVRVAEQIALLDNLSGGRLLLGIGRGIARIEYEGFGVDMDTSRERFVGVGRGGARAPWSRVGSKPTESCCRSLGATCGRGPSSRSAAAPMPRPSRPTRCRSWLGSASAS